MRPSGLPRCRTSRLLDGLAQRFRPLPDHFGTPFRQNQGELLASVTAGDILAANVGLQQDAELAQKSVAGFMAEGVVEVLEPVEIEHDHAERTLIARCAPQFEFEGFLHETAVEEIRQRIADRLAAQRFVQLEVGESHRDVLRHGHGQALFRLGQACAPRVARGRGCREPHSGPSWGCTDSLRESGAEGACRAGRRSESSTE